jgi:fructoselysine-6-P-deglycase FrlB-like protein
MMIGHEGLRLMATEMEKQCLDALATLDACETPAREIGNFIGERRRLVLYGIGGSHYVNRIVEPLYREAGIECRGMSPSEALMAPLPPADRVALFVSQSGESGEIVELLSMPTERDRRFGLTLNGDSTLARNVDLAIVAAGGPENAFAATRSIILTIAMHGAILERLGMDIGRLRAVFTSARSADMSGAEAFLRDADVTVFAGRHVMQGVAQSAALSLMELARVPAVGLESGQFRHGAFEFLRPGVGVVLLRSAGPDFSSIAPIARTCVEAGCRTVIVDTSGEPVPDGCLCVSLPRNGGLAAAASILLTLQHFNITLARQNLLEGIGTPRFTSKVTV